MKSEKHISDSELANKIRSGEKAAYQELFDRYAPRIYNFSFSYLKNNSDAEELVQNVFLKIWEKREMLDESKNIKAFIYKIAVNIIYDFIRRKNIENAYDVFIREQKEASSDNTWQTVIFDEMLAKLYKLIEQLPVQQQKIFLLNKLDNLTCEEISQKLNISKRTVENHLYRAVSFLKIHFKDSLYSLLFFSLL